MIRAALDTNVYISALNFGGVPLKVLQLARQKVYRLCISRPVCEEVRRVLAERFLWSAVETDQALRLILGVSRVVDPETRLAVAADPADNRILECAVAARADFVVTGDDHLLRLRSVEGIQIVTPRVFLETLSQS